VGGDLSNNNSLNGHQDVAEDMRLGRPSNRAMRLRSISRRFPDVAALMFVLLTVWAQTSPSWASDHTVVAAEFEDPDYGKHGGYLLKPKYYEYVGYMYYATPSMHEMYIKRL